MNTTAWQEEAKKEHDRAFMVASCLTPEQQLRLDIYKASGARPFDVSLANEHGEAFRKSINEACQFILTGEVVACEGCATSPAVKRYALQLEKRLHCLRQRQRQQAEAAFNEASSLPLQNQQALSCLIYQLLEKGVAYCEAKAMLQQALVDL